MTVTSVFSDIMDVLSPILILSGWLALTLSLISLLINTLLNVATGKGFTISLK